MTRVSGKSQGHHAPVHGEFDSAKKVLGDAAAELRRVAPGSSQVEELLAQAEILEENLRWMSEERYAAASKKQMPYQRRTSHQRRKKREP